MTSVLENQRIRRPHRFPERTGNSAEATAPKRRGRLRFLIRHGVILSAILFLLLYMAGASERLLGGSSQSVAAPTPRKAGTEVEILARPASARALPSMTDRRPNSHVVQTGETLYGLSMRHSLPLYHLILWNRITDPTKIRPGQPIRLARPIDDFLKAPPPAAPRISASVSSGNPPLKVKFTFDSELPEGSFMWDLGNWNFAFERSPTYVYSEPGLFTVKLRSYNNAGQEIPSNSLTVRVLPAAYRNANRSYITLDRRDAVLNLGALLNGESSGDGSSSVRVNQQPELFTAVGNNRYQAESGGYSRLTVQANGSAHLLYAFVSPLSSRHAWEPDYDWYKTQFGTGISGNCGPATAAMASYWAGGIDTSVSSIRSEIGMPYANGAITFDNMRKPLEKRGIRHEIHSAETAEELQAVIDRGNIAVVLINTSRIEHVGGDARSNLFGRYYWDSTGHYVIVKGYSLDHRYFIVYDPIPSDWTDNRLRYADGTSMLGRNRYYLSSQFMRAMKQPEILEIMRE